MTWMLLGGLAQAHGLWGHVHVTGWAVENRPDDELRAFLLDPPVFNALLFGAVFTDSGYAQDDEASRAFSEHAHWEPFVEDYIQWIRANDPPPWTSLESRMRVAFLLGAASHGLQDEVFDSLFLYQVEERDQAGQEATDPATDGFLSLDGHLRFFPEQELPMDTLLELMSDVHPGITEQVILDAVELTTSVYINDTLGPSFAAGLGELHGPTLPWTRVHYLDPAVPGSLRAEIFPTMHYQEAVWERLHGRLPVEESVVFTYPEAPRRLLSGDPSRTDSWSTFIFGRGVRYTEGSTALEGPDGPVAFTQGNTRWGVDFPRLIRLMPAEPLAPGGWYTDHLLPGLEFIDGARSSEGFEHRYQVECDPPDPALCPDLGPIPEASLDGLPVEAADPGDEAEAAAGLDEGGCACQHGAGRAGALPLLAAFLLFRRRALNRR